MRSESQAGAVRERRVASERREAGRGMVAPLPRSRPRPPPPRHGGEAEGGLVRVSEERWGGEIAARAAVENEARRTREFAGRRSGGGGPAAPPLCTSHFSQTQHHSTHTLTILHSGRHVSSTVCRTELEGREGKTSGEGRESGVPCGAGSGRGFPGRLPPPSPPHVTQVCSPPCRKRCRAARGLGKGAPPPQHTHPSPTNAPRARCQQVRAHARQHGGKGCVVLH